MDVAQSYIVEFYRKEPGDIGIDDLILLPDQDLELIATKALLGYSDNLTIAAVQRPHHARVLSGDRFKCLMTLMIAGPRIVEKV